MIAFPAQLDPADDDGAAPAREAGGGAGQVPRRRRLLGRRRPRQRQRRRRAQEDGPGIPDTIADLRHSRNLVQEYGPILLSFHHLF